MDVETKDKILGIMFAIAPWVVFCCLLARMDDFVYYRSRSHREQRDKFDTEEYRREKERKELVRAKKRREAEIWEAREAQRRRMERRMELRSQMDKGLFRLLDELDLFDRPQRVLYLPDREYSELYGDNEPFWKDTGSTVAEAFIRDGITTLVILAGRQAGNGGGIQPQRLERDYGIPPGLSIDLKQRAIGRVKRPARSPSRA